MTRGRIGFFGLAVGVAAWLDAAAMRLWPPMIMIR
jgi:hypothetical protein